jgi:hypothetical protein
MKPDLLPHAKRRCQQRAVPTLIASLLLDYGTTMRHEGADVVYVDKAARKRIQEAIGGSRNIGMVERWLNSYAVVDNDGRIITVARRRQRLKRP